MSVNCLSYGRPYFTLEQSENADDLGRYLTDALSSVFKESIKAYEIIIEYLITPVKVDSDQGASVLYALKCIDELYSKGIVVVESKKIRYPVKCPGLVDPDRRLPGGDRLGYALIPVDYLFVIEKIDYTLRVELPLRGRSFTQLVCTRLPDFDNEENFLNPRSKYELPKKLS